MSLTDKETQQTDEVQFAGSMRHRKLPRARRRKKKVPEISSGPVGLLDPLTGEITIPDEDDFDQISRPAAKSRSRIPDSDEVTGASQTAPPARTSASDRQLTDDRADSELHDRSTGWDSFMKEDDLADSAKIDELPDFDTKEFSSHGIDEEIPDFDSLDAKDELADDWDTEAAGEAPDNEDEFTDDWDTEAAGEASDNEDEFADGWDTEETGKDQDAEDELGDVWDLEDLDDDLEAEDDEDGRNKKKPAGKKSFLSNFRNRRTTGKKTKKRSGGNAGAQDEDADKIDDADESEDPETEEHEEEEPEVIHNPVIRYDPDLTYGLTAEEASDREAAGLINVSVRKGQKTVQQIVLSHTLTYFNLLNIVLGILVATTGQWKNMLFLGIIIGNSAIGIFQELKVKSLIDNLTVITAAHVFALRDGQEEEIPVDKIVVDDVIKLMPGDQIVTDGRVFDCRGLEVNESMLTGESQPVKKSDGESVLSGSFIIAGTAMQRVDKVGADSYASQLVAKASHKKRASSEMQRTIGRIIKVVSVVIIPVGLLLYRSQLVANDGVFADAIIRTVSGIIGMIPEGLVLLTSVSFIIGVGRLANKKALVQEMPSIESLARADIICTDKTGTITTGELRVNEVLPMGRVTRDEVMEIMAHMGSAFTDTNVTQDALNAAFGKSKGWAVRSIIPFSSERKFRAVSFDGHGDYVLGAPEFIVPNNQAALEIVDSYSQQGYRVLLLGRSKEIDPDTGDKGAVTPIAAIIISDVIKEDAKETFAYFAKAGVDIKVLSGDNPLTVSSVARKAGVAGAEKYIDATKLPDDPAALQQAVMKYSVFGRVKPEQKQAFIKAWQAGGKTVAMVGDGVNDVLAIKDADCGIAMASGSEAAKQAAHIVLMDSDFASMKDIVKEGKTIIANIERVSSLYLTKTIYSCLLCVIFILLKTPYPFTTLQMGLINLCGIGMPSFLLTLEQQENVTSDGFLKHVLQTALPAALTMVTSMLVVQILNAIFPWSTDIFSTFNLMLGGLVSLLVVASVCWPLAPYRKFVLVVSAIVFLGAVILLPQFYDMHSIFMWWSLLLLPLAVMVMILIALYSMLTQKIIIEAGRLRHDIASKRKRYDPDIY